MKKIEKIEILRHSTAHVLAAAVLGMFPEAKFGMGPAVENGFYYDFDLPRTLIPEDLEILENKMKEIIKANIKFEQADASIEEAENDFKELGQSYKVELIRDLKEEGHKKVCIYRAGIFVDLCSGPHLDYTGEIPADAFKLTRISGAYWKSDEKNKQLQRIYGVAFESKKDLDEYLRSMEDAKERDHRKIGKELKLFHIDENVGKGLPLWMPKGAAIRQVLQRFIEDEETKRGYLRTYTPVIGNVKLYKISGHWDHYKNDMYPPIKIDDEEYILRPMTCPHQFMIYKAEQHSYRELPLRYAELAEMYRKEKSGELSGLMRVMGFTLNDAHIFCTPEQLEKEFLDVLDLIQFSLKALGINKEVSFRASLRDKEKSKYLNNDKLWDESEKILTDILDKAGIKYEVGVGEAAFYGPKADIQIKNVLGKEETIITMQIDLNSAERFDLFYIDQSGKKQRPVIIHRSAIGCIERTMAFLIEHYAGAFPVWLSSVQVIIIPVSEKFNEYGEKIFEELKNKDIRAEIDKSSESLGKRIREAEKQKIPYILVVGEKEEKAESVAVRMRENKKQEVMKIKEFIEKIEKEIKEKI
ncbi:MAG: threonine--tRNA ligase [Candidatus Moranbacteria bacterium]|nr:threonine--tRNA ligase [Candidatus Moranbacteria bacterium]